MGIPFSESVDLPRVDTTAELTAANSHPEGRIAWVSDIDKIYASNGSAWAELAAQSGQLPSYTTAALPAAGVAGRLARVTDGIRGIWIDTGTQWHSITGHADVKDFGAKGDGTTDDTTAIQAAVNALTDTEFSRVIFFPGGDYKVTSTLQISRKGVQFVGVGGGRPQTGQPGGSRLSYSGTGPLVQLGTDDALALDAANYDGLSSEFGARFISFRYSGAGLSALANGLGNYGTGTYGIRDWRGGSIYLDNCWFENFEYGFWGSRSDLDHFEKVLFIRNKTGIYLGPRSDQFTAVSLQGFFNDRYAEMDRCVNSKWMGCAFVENGTATQAGVRIGSAFASQGSLGHAFYGCWFEHLTATNPIVMPAFIDIGVGDTLSTSKEISVRDSTVLCNSAGGSVSHFARIETADRVLIDGMATTASGSFGFTKLIQFLGTTSPIVTVEGDSTILGAAPHFTNSGSGIPKVRSTTVGTNTGWDEHTNGATVGRAIRLDHATDDLPLLRLEKRDGAGAGGKRWDFLIDDVTGNVAVQPVDANGGVQVRNTAGVLAWDVNSSTGTHTLKDGANLVVGTTTGTKIGTASTGKLGAYGATPIVQPSGTPANATDLATALTLVNDLKAKLIALGWIA